MGRPSWRWRRPRPGFSYRPWAPSCRRPSTCWPSGWRCARSCGGGVQHGDGRAPMRQSVHPLKVEHDATRGVVEQIRRSPTTLFHAGLAPAPAARSREARLNLLLHERADEELLVPHRRREPLACSATHGPGAVPTPEIEHEAAAESAARWELDDSSGRSRKDIIQLRQGCLTAEWYPSAPQRPGGRGRLQPYPLEGAIGPHRCEELLAASRPLGPDGRDPDGGHLSDASTEPLVYRTVEEAARGRSTWSRSGRRCCWAVGRDDISLAAVAAGRGLGPGVSRPLGSGDHRTRPGRGRALSSGRSALSAPAVAHTMEI